MATKKTEVTRDILISKYMQYKLEHNEKPKSVYQFAKDNGFDEHQFYTFFGSIEGIEKDIFKQFFEKTIRLLEKDPSYSLYDMRSKILSFYFTFFEMLTANRSYVVMSLKESGHPLKSVMQLTSLREVFHLYVLSILTEELRTPYEKLRTIQEKTVQESSWIQFLFTLKFWLDDNSPSFEKTDLFIEKSVKASFDLMQIAPMESLIDFGKFLFKEKMQHNS